MHNESVRLWFVCVTVFTHASVLLCLHSDMRSYTRPCPHTLWNSLRDNVNEMGTTVCTVTKVTVRRTSRGHCRQDIPLGEYDRKLQGWTLQVKTRETMYLMKLTTRGDDSSLEILNKIRSGKWNSRPPNPRLTKTKHETSEEHWTDISVSPPPTPPSSPHSQPTDTPDWVTSSGQS